MNAENKQFFSTSIVLIGDFQPAMFQPFWFRMQDAISEEEYNYIVNSKKEDMLITNNSVHFETGQFDIQITQNRFQIICKNKTSEIIIDFFKKIFDSLSSMPITAYGINFIFHIEAKDKREMKRIGQTLSPWKNWNPLLLEEDDNEGTGITSITATKQKDYGRTNLTISVSDEIKHGIKFSFNFHHLPQNMDQPFMMADIEEQIDEYYKNYEAEVNNITGQIIERLSHYE